MRQKREEKKKQKEEKAQTGSAVNEQDKKKKQLKEKQEQEKQQKIMNKMSGASAVIPPPTTDNSYSKIRQEDAKSGAKSKGIHNFQANQDNSFERVPDLEKGGKPVNPADIKLHLQSESDKGDESLASEISDERNGPESINRINNNNNPRRSG